jgi:hypothetical protein
MYIKLTPIGLRSAPSKLVITLTVFRTGGMMLTTYLIHFLKIDICYRKMPVKQELKTKDTQSKIEDQVQEHKVQVQVQVQPVRVKEIDTYHSIKWLTGC